MSTVNIQIRTPRSHLEFNKTGQRVTNLVKLVNLLSGYASGSLAGEIYVSGSTAATLVAASSTATLTYASLANNVDTWVAFGVTITCVTGTPTSAQFKKETDATVSAANLAAAINAHTTLVKYCTATSAAAVVTITLHHKGSTGNFITTNTSAGTGIANAAWASGAGGTEQSPTQVR